MRTHGNLPSITVPDRSFPVCDTESNVPGVGWVLFARQVTEAGWGPGYKASLHYLLTTDATVHKLIHMGEGCTNTV